MIKIVKPVAAIDLRAASRGLEIYEHNQRSDGDAHILEEFALVVIFYNTIFEAALDSSPV